LQVYLPQAMLEQLHSDKLSLRPRMVQSQPDLPQTISTSKEGRLIDESMRGMHEKIDEFLYA